MALEEYIYDDSAVESPAKGGHRLVGAARADVENIPFLVGYRSNDTNAEDYIECTGLKSSIQTYIIHPTNSFCSFQDP